MKGVYVLNIEALTDVGKVRKINEDSFRIREGNGYAYAIVADGMGGHLAGEVASRMAVEIIGNYIDEHIECDMDHFQIKGMLINAFTRANCEIYAYSCENESVMGMGTTATACVLRGGYLIYAHVGDSRAYTVGDTINRITNDHSYVQELVKLGQITPEEAKTHPRRNYITRAMGVEETMKTDSGIKTYNGDRILICSDGLHGKADDDELFEIISANTPKESVRKMVELANERGGEDNITAVVMEGDKRDA